MLTGFLRFVFTSTVHVSTCTVSHCVRSIMVCSYSVVSLCSFRVHLSSTVCASLRLHCVPSTVVFPRSFVVYSAYPYGYTLRSSNALFLLEFSVRTVYSACLYGNTLRFVYCVVGSLFGPCRLQCVSLRQHTVFARVPLFVSLTVYGGLYDTLRSVCFGVIPSRPRNHF